MNNNSIELSEKRPQGQIKINLVNALNLRHRSKYPFLSMKTLYIPENRINKNGLIVHPKVLINYFRMACNPYISGAKDKLQIGFNFRKPFKVLEAPAPTEDQFQERKKDVLKLLGMEDGVGEESEETLELRRKKRRDQKRKWRENYKKRKKKTLFEKLKNHNPKLKFERGPQVLVLGSDFESEMDKIKKADLTRYGFIDNEIHLVQESRIDFSKKSQVKIEPVEDFCDSKNRKLNLKLERIIGENENLKLKVRRLKNRIGELEKQGNKEDFVFKCCVLNQYLFENYGVCFKIKILSKFLEKCNGDEISFLSNVMKFNHEFKSFLKKEEGYK